MSFPGDHFQSGTSATYAISNVTNLFVWLEVCRQRGLFLASVSRMLLRLFQHAESLAVPRRLLNPESVLLVGPEARGLAIWRPAINGWWDRR